MYVGFLMNDNPHYHVTVAFNGKHETKAEYQRAVLSAASVANGWPHGPMALRFEDELEHFEDADVWYARVVNAQIQELHERLKEQNDFFQVWYPNDYEDYIPHVTIVKGEPKPDENPYLHKLEIATRLSVVSYEYGKTHLLI